MKTDNVFEKKKHLVGDPEALILAEFEINTASLAEQSNPINGIPLGNKAVYQYNPGTEIFKGEIRVNPTLTEAEVLQKLRKDFETTGLYFN
jgi:plastocyanin domain-containing protein